MVAPIIIPEPQFCDANGQPYAGGTIATYVVGTDTPKSVWQDQGQTVLQTNPIVLDAAGRCLMWGDGVYRLVLRDGSGNLIWDQPSTTIVSAAMTPVVAAATIAQAVTLLGISGMIQTETNRAEAAESTLQTNINTETSRATAAEGTLTTNLNNEISRAEAAENNLQSQITAAGGSTALPAGYSFRFGSLTSAANGAFTITFSPVFPTACISVVTTSGPSNWSGISSFSASQAVGTTSSPLVGGNWNGGPFLVNWMAIGH